MPGQVPTQVPMLVTFIEEVADALDDNVGHILELGTTANEQSVKLADDTDNAIGVMVSKLQDTTGEKAAVSVALIDAGGIVRVKAGGTISKGDGVAVAADGEVTTLATGIGTDDQIGIAMEAAVDQDLFNIILSRQTPA